MSNDDIDNGELEAIRTFCRAAQALRGSEASTRGPRKELRDTQEGARQHLIDLLSTHDATSIPCENGEYICLQKYNSVCALTKEHITAAIEGLPLNHIFTHDSARLMNRVYKDIQKSRARPKERMIVTKQRPKTMDVGTFQGYVPAAHVDEYKQSTVRYRAHSKATRLEAKTFKKKIESVSPMVQKFLKHEGITSQHVELTTQSGESKSFYIRNKVTKRKYTPKAGDIKTFIQEAIKALRQSVNDGTVDTNLVSPAMFVADHIWSHIQSIGSVVGSKITLQSATSSKGKTT
jgi:hypothetical protein